MLTVSDLCVRYGGVQVLWNVSIRVDAGEIVSVLGTNGAGKSTLLKAVVGLARSSSGAITFAGDRIDGLAPHRISGRGIAYGPEGGGLFHDMSVRENLELGAYHATAWARRRESLESVFEMFPVLRARRDNHSRTLSGGERQMLVMGRALMARPTMCIFDEPTIGLAPALVDGLFETLERIRDDGITVLLVEQNVHRSLQVSDRTYVLVNGRVTLDGPSAELMERNDIARSYLGM